MTDEIETEYICVDLEECADGKKRIKRLEDGSHPMDIMGRVLFEEDEKYKESHGGMPGLEWVILKESGPGGRPHQVFKLVSLENGGRTVIKKLVLEDNATGQPVPCPINLKGITGTGKKSMDRRDTVEQIGQIFDFEKAKAEIARRGVKIRAGTGWGKLEKAKRELEA